MEPIHQSSISLFLFIRFLNSEASLQEVEDAAGARAAERVVLPALEALAGGLHPAGTGLMGT